MLRILTVLLFSLVLTGCVTVGESQPKLVSITGVAGAEGVSLLPKGAELTVAIIDAKVRGAILAQKHFTVAKLPVLFKFQLPEKAIDPDADYLVVAMVKLEDRLLLQSYERFPVISNGERVVTVTMERPR
ncbi:chaperone for general secretion pathway YbaY [Ferrimonas sediminicola]|uniref:Chaperone for general secretion pathway YbaY n=1 Tax=Ferrimonas sediminicola TaxID=2569538 RepID=A0A4U1BEX2_9GAMM|nr:YbaY family lipoprotein [Ferrimonas sediminicola]TKB49784.1 chaperone for general secretion pathway YbaY [Ferrimonas sediminicola]